MRRSCRRARISIKSIRTKAATAGNSVYELAQIPAPATPTPVSTLGMPTDFSDQSGSLTLKWKCGSPARRERCIRCFGATRRRESSNTSASSTNTFIDQTIPAGSSQVTYQVQAVRSTATGPWAQFNVNFGVSGGTTTATVEQTAPAKKAA